MQTFDPPTVNHPEWILADCPACGKTMKFRRGMMGTRAMLCPGCMAPISVEIVTVEVDAPAALEATPKPAAANDPPPETTSTSAAKRSPAKSKKPKPAPKKRTTANGTETPSRKRKGKAIPSPATDIAEEKLQPTEQPQPTPAPDESEAVPMARQVEVVNETPSPTEEPTQTLSIHSDLVEERTFDSTENPKRSLLPEPRKGLYSKGQTFRASGLGQSPAANQNEGTTRFPLPTRSQTFFAQQINGAAAPSDRLAPNTARPSPEYGGGPKHMPIPGVRKIPGPAPSVSEPVADQSPSREESATAEQTFNEMRTVSKEAWEHLKSRRKEIRRQPRLVDWDTPEVANMPSAEVRADNWLEPGPDLLPESLLHSTTGVEAATSLAPPIEENISENHELKRKKRTERRKITSRLEFSWKFFAPAFRWGLLALVLPVLGAGVWLVLKSFNKGAVPSDTLLAESDQKVRKRDLALAREELSEADTAGAVAAVRKLLSADGVEAKLAFVRKPDQVRPLMQQWYATHPSTPTFAEHVEHLSRKKRVGEYYLVFLGMLVGPTGKEKEQYFAVEQIYPNDPEKPISFLVDWESSAGYQSVDFAEYLAKQPTSPVEFRVLMKPDVYYNFGFEDQKQWHCYRLTCPGDAAFNLYGYVEKGSPLAEEIMSQLFVEPNVILSVRYPEKPISRDQVIIEKIVHPTWFPEDTSAVPAGKP